MSTATKAPARAGLVLVATVALLGGGASCRKGTASPTSSFNALSLPLWGTHGCNGANQVFVPPQVPVEVPLATLVLGPWSQIAALQAGEVLYATGAGATVVVLDFTGGSPPVETELVGAGIVDALLAGLGIAGPAELAGVAIADEHTLVVAEHASNTLLLVSRDTPDTVALLAGYPSGIPGFADGVDQQIRFSFTGPAPIVPTGDGYLLVADPGNHAVRFLAVGTSVSSLTICGNGAPGFADGMPGEALLDTPAGLTAACDGRLLVVERGTEGIGGHRLRAIAIGDYTFFGLLGDVTTLAGDGTDETAQGTGGLARLAGPVSLASTSEGDVYWIDATTGILRRHASATGETDCPMFTDCAEAVGGAALFTPGGRFSLAVTAGDVLYVVDAGAGKLLRVTP
ncbi:MAG: hypothetical protein AB1726_12845 [Planctomycetota bacterium]